MCNNTIEFEFSVPFVRLVLSWFFFIFYFTCSMNIALNCIAIYLVRNKRNCILYFYSENSILQVYMYVHDIYTHKKTRGTIICRVKESIDIYYKKKTN